MKKHALAALLLLALGAAFPLHAQSGCDDSPENPTLILAGLAGGAFAVSNIRTRLRARRVSRHQ